MYVGGKAAPAGFTVKAPARPSAAAANGQGDESSDGGDDSSGWETASESDGDTDGQGGGEGSEEWSEWDPCVSFFDNKVSSSMEENLKYMYKKFGFFLPDAEYLADPEGLIKYLGAKLAHGKVRVDHLWPAACIGALMHGMEGVEVLVAGLWLTFEVCYSKQTYVGDQQGSGVLHPGPCVGVRSAGCAWPWVQLGVPGHGFSCSHDASWSAVMTDLRAVDDKLLYLVPASSTRGVLKFPQQSAGGYALRMCATLRLTPLLLHVLCAAPNSPVAVVGGGRHVCCRCRCTARAMTPTPSSSAPCMLCRDIW